MQLRIEAQGKYLQGVLEKAQETLGRQNLGTTGLEDAKVQLSELASKVSNQCVESTLLDNNKGLSLRAGNGTPFIIANKGDLSLCDHLQEKVVFLSPSNDDAERRDSGLMSLSIGFKGEESYERSPVLKEKSWMRRERTENEGVSGRLNHEKISQNYKPSIFQTELDLNVHHENDASSHCQQFDLNGFSWNC